MPDSVKSFVDVTEYSTNFLAHTGNCWYLRGLPVLHRLDVVDIGVNTIQKDMPYAKGTIELDHFKYSACTWRFM